MRLGDCLSNSLDKAALDVKYLCTFWNTGQNKGMGVGRERAIRRMANYGRLLRQTLQIATIVKKYKYRSSVLDLRPPNSRKHAHSHTQARCCCCTSPHNTTHTAHTCTRLHTLAVRTRLHTLHTRSTHSTHSTLAHSHAWTHAHMHTCRRPLTNPTRPTVQAGRLVHATPAACGFVFLRFWFAN